MACLGAFVFSWIVGYAICRAILRRSVAGVPRYCVRLGLGWAAGAAFSGMTTFWAIALAPGTSARGSRWPMPRDLAWPLSGSIAPAIAVRSGAAS